MSARLELVFVPGIYMQLFDYNLISFTCEKKIIIPVFNLQNTGVLLNGFGFVL